MALLIVKDCHILPKHIDQKWYRNLCKYYVVILVDIHEAGAGDLGVIIMCDGETVQSAVSQGQDGLLYVSFEVQKAKPHKVYVTYNQEPVLGKWVG